MKLSLSHSSAKQKPKTLMQFTISYLMLIFIPIAMGIVNYSSDFAAAKRQLIQSNGQILAHTVSTMEGSLNSIQDFGASLNGLDYLDKIIRSTSVQSIDIRDLQSASRLLPLYRDSVQYVKTYYLYSQQNNLLLSPGQIFFEIEPYYDYIWGNSAVSYAEWKATLLDSSPVSSPFVLIPADDTPILFYQMLYVGRQIDISGKIFFELDTTQIRQSLESAFTLGAGFYYLADQNGSILLSAGEVPDLSGWQPSSASQQGYETVRAGGRTLLLTYCHSGSYGLDFVIGIPQSQIHESCLRDLRVSLVGTVFLIAAGIALILGSYHYNQRPLALIARDLRPADEPHSAGTRNGLWRLASSARNVIQRNASIELLLQEQELRLREAFLIQLEFGGILDREKLSENLIRYQLPFMPESSCRGAYLQFEEELDLQQRSRLSEEIGRAFSSLQACLWLDPQHLSMLCADSLKPRGDGILKQLYNYLKEEEQLEVRIFAGSSCPLNAISRSFSEARGLLQISRDSSERFLFLYDKEEFQQAEIYNYTSQQEERLLEMTDMGNDEAVKQGLRQIYQENFAERTLTPYMKKLLLYRMLSTLFCSRYSSCLKTAPPDLSKISAEDFFAFLEAQYSRMCEEAVNMQAKKQNENEQRIIAYLNEHYRDSDLSLTSLSMQFGMTEIYLSSLIKKLLNENFQSYVEKRRIQDANALLAEQRFTISQIGAMVGYENANSFSRAYKRIMGYSPSQYIKLLRQDNK